MVVSSSAPARDIPPGGCGHGGRGAYVPARMMRRCFARVSLQSRHPSNPPARENFVSLRGTRLRHHVASRRTLPTRRWLVEDAAILAATPLPAVPDAEQNQEANEGSANQSPNDGPSDCAPRQRLSSGVSHWCGCGRGSREDRGKDDGWRDVGKNHVGAALLRLRVVAARVGRVNTSRRAVRAETQRAVCIAAVVGFVENARDAHAA